MTMPRRAADFRLLPQAQEKTSVQPEGLHRRKKSSPDAKKRSRCRQVPRRRSGVSDLSAPACAGGLHSDPLAGLCTPFRLSAQRTGRIVCRYFILSILKYHIKNGFSSRMGEKCGEEEGKMRRMRDARTIDTAKQKSVASSPASVCASRQLSLPPLSLRDISP